MFKTSISLFALLAATPALGQALPGSPGSGAEPATVPVGPAGTATDAERDNPIVVTGTRSLDGQPARLDGSSLTLIDSAAIEQRQTRVVSDVLRDVPGVAVSRSGGVGGSTQVRLRGAEANQTLVLIDGIEVSDPFQGEFDFATLVADDVSRVEVLRGQQSAIYGSDAIGGVVHYITATGAEAPGVRGRIEGGSFGTLNTAARVAGLAGGLDYALSGTFNRTDGTATARRGIGDRRLDAQNQAFSGKFGYAVTPTLTLDAVGRYSRTEADTNPQDFDFRSPTYGFVVDGTDSFATRSLYGLLRARLDLLDGRWSHALTGQVVDVDRASRTDGDTTFATRGDRLKAAYDTSFRVESGEARHTFTVAADYEKEGFRNVALFGNDAGVNGRRTIENLGLVGEYDLAIGDRFGFGASVRHDDNDGFGNATTYRLRGTVRLNQVVRLRGAAGSGIKNPTNFELFGFDANSFIGNPDLKPEKSKGWEAGVDLSLAADRIQLGATYFDSRLRNEIFTLFSPTFVASPANRTTRSTQAGVELFGQARLGGGWRVDLAYTYLDAEEDDAEEVRRAPHIASGNLTWRAPDDRFGATLTARYNGRQDDLNFTNAVVGPRVRLDDYALVNIAADYRLSTRVQLFGRVENLLDDDHEEVFTYRSPGLAAYAGVRAGF